MTNEYFSKLLKWLFAYIIEDFECEIIKNVALKFCFCLYVLLFFMKVILVSCNNIRRVHSFCITLKNVRSIEVSICIMILAIIIMD